MPRPRNRNHRNGDFKGQGRFHQFGFIAAGAVEGGRKCFGNGYTHKGRSHVRAVVHVSFQHGARRTLGVAHHSHRVHLEQQGGRGSLIRSFGVKEVGFSVVDFYGLTFVRMFMKQVTQVGSRAMRSGEGKEHRVIGFVKGGGKMLWVNYKKMV